MINNNIYVIYVWRDLLNKEFRHIDVIEGIRRTAINGILGDKWRQHGFPFQQYRKEKRR